MGGAGLSRPGRPGSARVPPTRPPPVMAAARSPVRSPFSNDDGFSADDGEIASFEVGAGVGDAPRRPFLRAVLADRGEENPGADDGEREVRVRDRFARLDAGLPPLPKPEGGWGDEDLSPAPAAHRVQAARIIAAATERATWQHLAPAVPAPLPAAEPAADVEPTAEAAEDAAPAPEQEDEPTPPAAATPLFAPMTPAPMRVRTPVRSETPVAPVAEAPEPEPEPEPVEPPAAEPPAAPKRRSIFRAFSG